MKKIFFVFFVFFGAVYSSAQIDKNLLVNIHEVSTTVEMNAISNAKKGDLVYNQEVNLVYVYNGTLWVGSNFEHTPYLTMASEIVLALSSTTTILVSGVDFTTATQISIPGLTINSFTVLSPNSIEVNITTTSASGYYDIIVNNDNKYNTSWPNNEKDRIHVQ